MKSRIVFLTATFALFVIVFSACKKESSGHSTLNIRLTDAPADYQEVNVDLEGVTVKIADESWIELDAVPGVYNLLGLQNGVDTLIATEVLPKGILQEIRLVLGTDNTIKVNGQTYPLVIPSGSESGLKIKVNKNLESSVETLIIDFDAALSVQQEGTEDYKLRPVLKIK